MGTLEIPFEKLAVVDVETTGLLMEHEVYEVGLIIADRNGVPSEQRHWFLPVDLGNADPIALRVGRFHERHPDGYFYENPEPANGAPVPEMVEDVGAFAKEFCALVHRSLLVGANVAFDAPRLDRRMRRSGASLDVDYHIIDIEAMAFGFLCARGDGLPIPSGHHWDSSALSLALGIDPARYPRHTAFGDCQWVLDQYRVIAGTATGASTEPATFVAAA